MLENPFLPGSILVIFAHFKVVLVNNKSPNLYILVLVSVVEIILDYKFIISSLGAINRFNKKSVLLARPRIIACILKSNIF